MIYETRLGRARLSQRAAHGLINFIFSKFIKFKQ